MFVPAVIVSAGGVGDDGVAVMTAPSDLTCEIGRLKFTVFDEIVEPFSAVALTVLTIYPPASMIACDKGYSTVQETDSPAGMVPLHVIVGVIELVTFNEFAVLVLVFRMV